MIDVVWWFLGFSWLQCLDWKPSDPSKSRQDTFFCIFQLIFCSRSLMMLENPKRQFYCFTFFLTFTLKTSWQYAQMTENYAKSTFLYRFGLLKACGPKFLIRCNTANFSVTVVFTKSFAQNHFFLHSHFIWLHMIHLQPWWIWFWSSFKLS